MLKYFAIILSILTLFSAPKPSAVSSAEEKPLALLANFHFLEDGDDKTGNNGPFRLGNTQFKDGGLYLNGIYEFGGRGGGYSAKCSMPKLDYSKFTVALRFRPEEFTPARSTLLVGGPAYRWFGLRRSDAGNLMIQFNNQDYSHEIAEAPLVADKWTVVSCGVDLADHNVVAYLNGKKVADFVLPDGFKLDVIDSSFKDRDRIWTFTNYSGGNVFKGLVSDFLVYRHKLTPEEFDRVPLRGESGDSK